MKVIQKIYLYRQVKVHLIHKCDTAFGDWVGGIFSFGWKEMLTIALRLCTLSHYIRRPISHLPNINLLYHMKYVFPTNMVFHLYCMFFPNQLHTMKGKVYQVWHNNV